MNPPELNGDMCDWLKPSLCLGWNVGTEIELGSKSSSAQLSPNPISFGPSLVRRRGKMVVRHKVSKLTRIIDEFLKGHLLFCSYTRVSIWPLKGPFLKFTTHTHG